MTSIGTITRSSMTTLLAMNVMVHPYFETRRTAPLATSAGARR